MCEAALESPGVIVLTTPNGFAASVLGNIIALPYDPARREHTYYYTNEILINLLRSQGYQIVERATCDREARSLLRGFVRGIASRLRPDLREVIVVVARPNQGE